MEVKWLNTVVSLYDYSDISVNSFSVIFHSSTKDFSIPIHNIQKISYNRKSLGTPTPYVIITLIESNRDEKYSYYGFLCSVKQWEEFNLLLARGKD